MKKLNLLVGGALLLAALFTTSCKEFMASLDNPVGSYVKIDQTTVVLRLGDQMTRVGETINTDGLEYSSSNPSVATVDPATGKVTALSVGTTLITASAPANEYYLAGSASYEVKVVSFNPQTTSTLIGVGDYETLDIYDAGTTGLSAVWTSSNNSIATVDQNGKVTAVAEGQATITVTVGGEQSASCLVTTKAKTNLEAVGAAYTAQDGDVLTGAMYYPLTIATGATVVLSDVHCYQNPGGYNPIACQGDATIILAENSNNTAWQGDNHWKADLKAGPAGTTLTLRGKGSFTVDAVNSQQAAVIGTDRLGTCGDIVIEDGFYTLNAGSHSVAIGAGDGGTCGNITIFGGEIHANGGYMGAGIGCGLSYNKPTTCGDITIHGGKVYANGGANAAGIGGGTSHNKASVCGNITINGGTVEARGGSNAAGIGTGYQYSDITNTCGNITITGGKVKAWCSGVYGAGIGTGIRHDWDAVNYPTCGNITLSGGEIEATMGSDALYDVGPGEYSAFPGIFTGKVGTVTVSVNVTNARGDVTKIYSADAAASAPRRVQEEIPTLPSLDGPEPEKAQ